MKQDSQPQKRTATKARAPSIDFPIVGVGASAGGLEAMEAFFRNVPAAPPMAFVVVQHITPNHDGYLAEILQRSTSMRVLEATDRVKVEPRTVYVIPPNKFLALLGGSLRLSVPSEVDGLRLPIDFFFQSLAAEMKEKSIGVILSGMGSDGSRGLLSIHEAKGIALLQNPETAKFPGMPSCAATLVPGAIAGDAGELPAKLVDRLSRGPASEALPVEPAATEKRSLEKVIALIRAHTGHDFSHYKKTTLNRRIERRKAVHQIVRTQSYVRFLRENPSEVAILFKELLIGVTQFFRDAALWEALQQKVVPALLARLPDRYTLRAWVPACSTGEEAYSLAILLKECLQAHFPTKNIALQIFATDIDPTAIDRARKGTFPRSIEADVSSARLKLFFDEEEDHYKIKASVRETVVFAVQSVTADPPFTKLDLLSCRNLLIYLEAPLQRQLISLFHYSIRPRGLLVLGSSESLVAVPGGFTALDPKLKIFERADCERIANPIDFPSSTTHTSHAMPESEKPASSTDNLQTLAEQIILKSFAPASLLVNSKGDILNVSGRTGKYLEPAVGKANWNVFAMARKGLREILPGAFRAALGSPGRKVYPKLHVGTDGGIQIVDMTLLRMDQPKSIEGMVLIVFEDVATQVPHTIAKDAASSTQQQLEAELQASHDELRRSREEMQTSDEELKSMNEELQSTNEELQSTNEELTTSKEEMQSLNEELQTVNAELQNKVSEYQQSSDDMKNLLNSTEVATLFLDQDLNVRRFTDQITNVFKLRDIDVGRPFTDLVTDLQYPEIGANAKGVLKTLGTREDQVTTSDGRWFSVRIMPYRTIDDRIDGLVMTFTDISIAKKLATELMAANQALDSQPKTQNSAD